MKVQQVEGRVEPVVELLRLAVEHVDAREQSRPFAGGLAGDLIGRVQHQIVRLEVRLQDRYVESQHGLALIDLPTLHAQQRCNPLVPISSILAGKPDNICR